MRKLCMDANNTLWSISHFQTCTLSQIEEYQMFFNSIFSLPIPGPGQVQCGIWRSYFLLPCVEGPRCLYEKAQHCWNLAMLISKQPHNEININIPILQKGNLTKVTSSKQSLNSKPHLSDPTSGFISLTLYEFLFLNHSVIWSSVMTDYVPTIYQTLFWSEQDRKSSYPWGSYIIMDKADNKPVKQAYLKK